MSKAAQVTVLYPRKEGSTFNLDYYLSTHMPLVMKHWKQYGFTSYKVTQFAPDAPYSYGVTMEFDNIEGFKKAGQTESTKEIMDDIPNFSSEQPTLLAGETVGTG